jgi:hypothetical protein
MTTNPTVRIYRGDENKDLAGFSIAHHLSEKALHLRIFEEFLAQVETSAMRRTISGFDTSGLKQALRRLRSDESPEATEQAEVEISLWAKELTARDANIEAYHIRRYCDSLKSKLPVEVFLAAARFYRDLDYSRQSLSKFDLVITRAFSTDIGELRRTLITDREELAEKIAMLYSGWDAMCETNAFESGISADIVSRFDEFVEECVATDDFSTLSSSKLFDRIREYKSGLGRNFFHPKVVSAAIGCNVAVGNRLNYLMTKASENLGERLGSEYDLAGAFQDTSPNAGAYLNEVLANIRNEVELSRQVNAGSDLDLLRAMFRLASDVRFTPEIKSNISTAPIKEHEHLLSVNSRLDRVKFPISSAIQAAISDSAAPAEGFFGDCLEASLRLESSLSRINGSNITSDMVDELAGRLVKVENLANVAEEYLIGTQGSERELLLLIWNRLLQLALRVNRIAMRSGLQTLACSTQTSANDLTSWEDSVPVPDILSEIN